MIYDPKKAGIYSTENFAAWLETQPADKHYDYCDPKNCAVAQYLKAHGIEKFSLDPKEVDALGWGYIVQPTPDHEDWTFGNAAKTARGLLVTD